MLIGLLCTILFYGVCIWAICKDKGYKTILKNFSALSIVYIAAFFTIIIISTLLVVYWTKKNDFIYYWDYAGYWILTLQQKNSFIIILL